MVWLYIQDDQQSSNKYCIDIYAKDLISIAKLSPQLIYNGDIVNYENVMRGDGILKLIKYFNLSRENDTEIKNKNDIVIIYNWLIKHKRIIKKFNLSKLIELFQIVNNNTKIKLLMYLSG